MMTLLLMPVMLNYCILRTDCSCSNSGTCTGSGPELHWHQATVPYTWDPTGAPGTLTKPFDQTVDTAFQTWQTAAPTIGYTNDGQEGFGVTAVYPAGTTACDQSQTDGHSTVQFVTNNWVCGPATIAITYTWFGSDGVIGEADMMLNGPGFSWTDTDTGAQTDLQSIVTHESGHYLGLGHSGVPTATMWYSVPQGEITKRTLDPDDISAVAVVAGLQHSSGGSSTSPQSCGCSLDGDRREVRAGAMAGALLAMIAIGAALFRRRARRVLATLAIAGAAAGLAAAPRDARATTMVRMELPELAAQSDVVARGTIASVETKTDGRSIWTEQTFSVTRVLAGAAADRLLTIRTPGGTLPAGVVGPRGYAGLAVSGMPRFTTGDDVVLFLARDPRDVYGVVGFEQGRFDVREGGRLHRDMSDVLQMIRTPTGGLAPAPIGDELDGLTLDALAMKLRPLPVRGAAR